ncbi:MAG TPA: hypothetical protein VIS76_01235, partial [Pseudomonadales bacterium]
MALVRASGLAAMLLCIAVRALGAGSTMDVAALFAGQDGSFSHRPVASEAAALDSMLVGIVVDGQEVGMELVYRDGDAFYLPAALLARIGVSGRGSGDQLFLATPAGEVRADRA